MQINITKPISELRVDSQLLVDSLSSVKILAIYPLYRQNNISRAPLSDEAVAMYAYIDNIRALAQTAKASISTVTTTIVDIRTAESIFIESLAALRDKSLND